MDDMDGDMDTDGTRTGRDAGGRMKLLAPDELPEQTIQVVVKTGGQVYDLYCPLSMLQTLPALVQAELFRAQLMAMNPHAPDP